MKLREKKAAETKVRLAMTALRMFARRSLGDIPVGELCEAVGISEATFFNYFPRKSDVVLYLTQLISIDLIHASRTRTDRSSQLAVIEALYARVAELVVEYPWGMHEIFGQQTLMRTATELPRVTEAERRVAFPEIEMPVEEDMPRTVIDLIADHLARAIQLGEIPPIDVESATVGHYAIFFAVPIALTWEDPARVDEMYRRLLRVLWIGLGAIPAASGVNGPVTTEPQERTA